MHVPHGRQQTQPRHTIMKRVHLKPSTTPLKRSPINRRSKKTEDLYAGTDGRRAFVERHLHLNAFCVVRKECKLIASVAVDVHERTPRSAMGAIVPGEKADEQGQVFFAVCRPCHDFIHRDPSWSREKGFLQPKALHISAGL